MIVMLYDCETSGLPKWSEPSESPEQPHICQFTSVLFDDTSGEELEYVDLIIRQEWPVDPAAFAVHKITPEYSLEHGVPEQHAVQYFEAMEAASDRITGFSLDFDLRILRIAQLRAGRPKGLLDLRSEVTKVKKFDCMRVCTPICKVPPSEKMMAAGRKTFKQPSLVEAVKALFDRDMSDAHDARGDVLETKNIYMELKRRGLA